MNDVAPSDAHIRLGMFEAACDILAAAVIVYDRNDCLVFASRQVLRHFPIPADTLRPGTRLRDVLGAIFDSGVRYGIAPEQRSKAINREEWISARISAHWREQYEAVERLGRDRWVHFRKRRLPNGYNVTTLVDVSEQKKQEEQWRTDLERIALTEEILETLPSPVVIKDRNLAYIAVNKAFCAIHDTSPDSILGRSIWALADAESAGRIEASDRGVLETGEPFTLAEHLVRADGSDLYVITRKYRIGAPGNHAIVTLMQDVTALAAGQKVVTDSGDALLRVPGGFVEAQNCLDPVRDAERRLLLDQLAPEDLRAAAGRRVLIATPSPRIEDILVGEFKARGADCCAVASVHEHDVFLAIAAEHGLSIDLIVVDNSLPSHDALLRNGRGIATRLVVPDGIGPDFIRALVEEHELLSENASPLGDIVTPVSLADDWYIATDITTMLPAAVGDVEVLVAEDNQINQFVFSQILEGMGISHRIAENGEEAVMLWRKHQPRLVLMDISMPVMNGIDAAMEIRAAEKLTGTHTPIVAVTAQALNVDMQNCMDAGMDDYITKPVSPDMIEAIYRRYASVKPERSVA
ncbi:response regulator [Shinella zoogloeoides]|uniref:response regulator n=1 Tax=Shinella zoogloeoides TaxID=352475 RepID=UPI00273E0409|nr:response regulator [Shinella zoogloeoides]WLR93407.1 response regulator [Shinella zoogloeoides]